MKVVPRKRETAGRNQETGEKLPFQASLRKRRRRHGKFLLQRKKIFRECFTVGKQGLTVRWEEGVGHTNEGKREKNWAGVSKSTAETREERASWPEEEH